MAVLDARGAQARRLRRADARARERQRIFGGQVAGQALMAAGLTVPAERAGALAALVLPAARATRTEEIRYAVDRIRDGRSFSTRRVVAWQRPQGRGRRDLRADRRLPRRREAGGRALAADARRARAREPARRPRRSPPGTATARGVDERHGPGRRAALPRRPVHRAAEDPPDTKTWALVPGGRPAAATTRPCTPRR